MKVTSVHDNLEEKFNPQERYAICNAIYMCKNVIVVYLLYCSSLSDHNKQVSSRIINEIEKTTDAFSEDEIRGTTS